MRLQKIVRPVFYSVAAIAVAAVVLLGLTIYRHGIRVPASILHSSVGQDIALRYGVRYSLTFLDIGCLGRDCPGDVRTGALEIEIQIPEPLHVQLNDARWSRGNPLVASGLKVRSGNRPPMIAVDRFQADLQTSHANLNGLHIGLLPSGPPSEVGSVEFDATEKQVIARTLKLSSVSVDTIQLNGWAPAADNYIVLSRLNIAGVHVSPSKNAGPVTTICQQLPSSADLGGDVIAPLRPLLPLLLKDIEILHGDFLTIALAAAIVILILKLLSLLWLWRSLLMFLLPIFTAAAPFALYFLLRDSLSLARLVLVAAAALVAIAILFRVLVYRRGERWYQRWEPFVVDLASVVVLLPLLGYGIALPSFPKPPVGLQLDRIEVAGVDGHPTERAQFDIPQTVVQGVRIALPGTDPKVDIGVSSIQIPKTNIRVAPSSRITLDGMLVDDVNVAYDPGRREVGDIGAHVRLAGLFESDALAKELRNIEFLRGINMRSRVGFDADVRASGPEGPSKVSTQFPRSKNLAAVNAAVTLKPVECTASFDVAARIQTEPLMMTARADGDTANIRIRSLRSIPGSPIQIAGGNGNLKLSGAPDLSLNLDSISGSFGATPLSIASVAITASSPRPGSAGIQSATIAVGPTSIRPASGLNIRIANSTIHMDRMQDLRSVPVTFETRIDNVVLESADKRIEANFPSMVARITGQASPETIPRRFNGTIDFTAFGTNESDERFGTSKPVSIDADLWAGQLNVPEQEIRFQESLLSESRTEIPVQFRFAGRLSSISPHPNAGIESRAVIGHFEQGLGSARLALDNAVVSGRADWDERGSVASLNYGIESARIALPSGPSAVCLDEISMLDVSASGTISRLPQSSDLPSLASAPSVCATLPALPGSMQFQISGSYPAGPDAALVRLAREDGTGIRIPDVVNEIRGLQIRDGRLVRMETRVGILGVGTLQGPRSIDVQADLRQAKDSLQLDAGVLAPDGTRLLDVAVDSTPAMLALDATQHVDANRIVAQIQPFLSDLQMDLGRVNPQARLTQLHANANFENGELLNAAVKASLARGNLLSLESPELRASVATSPAGAEPSVNLNIGRASGSEGRRQIAASVNMSGAEIHAATDKDVAIAVDADLGVIAQGTLYSSGQPPASPVLDKVFQVGSGLGRQITQLATLLDGPDTLADASATPGPIENLQWKVHLSQNSPQAPLLQIAPDALNVRLTAASVDAAWDSATSRDRSRISLSTSLDSNIHLERNDVLLDVLSPVAMTYALDGEPENRIDSNIPIQAMFSERLNRASENSDSLWNPDFYAQFWRAHPSRFSGAAFATPIDFNELVFGPVSVREVRFPLEPLRLVVGYADALQVGLPFAGRVLYGDVTGNMEASLTALNGVATVDTRMNLNLKNLQAGAIGSTISGGSSSFVEDELDGKVAFRADGLTIDPTTLPALRAGHVSESELEKLGISVHLFRSRESTNLPGVLQASSDVQINLVNELLNQVIRNLSLPAPPRALTYKDLALTFDVDHGQVRTDTEVFRLGGVQLFSSTAVDATAEVRAHLGRPGERVLLGNLIEMLGSFGSVTESGGR